MSTNFPGNPFATYEPRTDAGGIILSLQLLAYEQRTTALVNLFGALTNTNRIVPQVLTEQIWERLGMTKDES